MDARLHTVTTLILAVTLGVLVHTLVGYAPFPSGDDFAYAPLADLRAQPELFPRDEQLRLFANHAVVYDWLYTLGRNGPGVEPVFRTAVVLLALLVSLTLLLILRFLQAPVALLPIVLGLGVVVEIDGLGRGDFGGLVSPFFHHHNVALVLIVGAVAVGLANRPVFAGLCLGLAAYAQPMTAAHGAVAVGFGTLLARPRDCVPLMCVSMLVALPAAWMIFAQGTPLAAEVGKLNLIEDAYRFRAPHHYDPAWDAIGVTTLYLLTGMAGAGLLETVQPRLARYAFGLMLVFLALHAVTVLVYKLGLGEVTALFVLDANRSSPLAFVLGLTFALAGIWHRGRNVASFATCLIIAAITVMNATGSGILLFALGLLILSFDRLKFANPIGALATVALITLHFPPKPLPNEISDETLTVLERIRTETPPDALFVVPIQFAAFRHYTQRSVFVDFKMFSVAQPDQAVLTRQRIEMISAPDHDFRSLTGWPAARLLDFEQHKRADCGAMLDILRRTDADYYLRLLTPDSPPPDCDALPRTIESSRLALYGPRSE